MHSMMTCRRLEDAAAIQQLHDSYLHTLAAPMDGMWESVFIAPAACWEILDHEQHAGYFCLGANNVLLRFQLDENYQGQAQALLRWVVTTHAIKQAIASTIEPMYFALCLDIQRSVVVHSYLFRDHQRLELSPDRRNATFRKAKQRELDDIVRFYRANVAGASNWIEGFLRERIDRAELFVLLDQETVVATGECIPSQQQTPYADLGMVVAQAYRSQGLGSTMLIHLKQHCYVAGWQPICSCVAENHASRRAIEKAGFISEQRMVKMLFADVVSSAASQPPL